MKAGLEIRQPPQDQSSPEDGSGSSSDEDSVFHDHGDYITCNSAWYGNPRIHDCDAAIEQLPAFLNRETTYREFLGILGPSPPRLAAGLDGPPIRTPIVRTSGM